jgi:D-amino-acid dehydrogenase
LSEALAGAIHFRGSPTSSDPGMLTKAYADLFIHRGGRFLKGDARQLDSHPSGWSLVADKGSIEAPEVVVALGPWSDDVFRPLGYQIPLAVKRGYHMHYGVKGNATLGHSVRDADGGFTLAPMRKGVRLTTGVEFADRDALPSPVQLARDEPLARELFPLTGRLEPEPWMGCRPCLPDVVPVIGKGEGHQGLWFAFGHAHHGFTLGPATGRLLSPGRDLRPRRGEPGDLDPRFREGRLLSGWVGATAAALKPLVDALAADVLASDTLHVDDTRCRSWRRVPARPRPADCGPPPPRGQALCPRRAAIRRRATAGRPVVLLARP